MKTYDLMPTIYDEVVYWSARHALYSYDTSWNPTKVNVQFFLWNWLLAKGENKQKEVGAYPLKNTLQYNVVSHFFLKNLGLFLHLFLLFSNKQY